MNLAELLFLAITCVVATPGNPTCGTSQPVVDAPASNHPQRTGAAVDVVVSAQAALVWDITTGQVLYDKQANTQRPVASLIKLLSMLYARQKLAGDTVVTIPPDVTKAQRSGANIRLPVGEHVTGEQLLAASAIASANDAIVTLAVAIAGSEEAFVRELNVYAPTIGALHTKAANATGLSGGEQYSTAQDIRTLLTRAVKDPKLAGYLQQQKGILTTNEGTKRQYETTNKLLGSYLPIVAAKTGYTVEAGENLAIITTGPAGQQVGAVILGSAQRFQDMKIIVEWIWRNYSWNK